MIPKQLQEEEFRFVLLKPKTKVAFESEWQKKGYKFNDPKLLQHLNKGGNYGVIGGFGNVVIFDVDDKTLAEQLINTFQTFTIKTCGGTYHFYFKTGYNTNHVLSDSKGEIRANNYYVVGPNCYAIDTKKKHEGPYKIKKDLPLLEISPSGFETIIQPYLKTTKTEKVDGDDNTRSAIEYRQICSLISKGLNKEDVFTQMSAFDKWNKTPGPYREYTYKKAFDFISKHGIKKKTNINKFEKDLAENPIKDLKSLLAEGIPEIRWRIDKLVPERGITILGGTSGSFKTWFAMNCALSISSGKSFLNTFDTSKTNVLYVDEENGNVTIPYRFGLLKKGWYDDCDFSNLFVAIFNNFKLDNEEIVLRLKKIIQEKSIKVVVFDSMVRCMEGVEDKAEDVRKVFDNLKQLMKEFNDISFVILHHTTKGGKGMNALRGSGDFAAFADCVTMFEGTKIGVNIETVKNRHVEREQLPRFSMKVNSTKDSNDKPLSVVLTYLEDQTTSNDVIADCIKDIEEWIGENDLERFQTKDLHEQMKKLGHKKNAIYTSMRNLCDSRSLTKLSYGKYQVNVSVITEEV